jgi:DNA topoisomerase-1
MINSQHKRHRNGLAQSLTQVDTSPATATLAGLHYVSDSEPGFRRVRRGAGFVYTNGRRHIVRNKRQLARFTALRIPPAWTEVWICAEENGHLQATGRDARGRKQYRYHDRWRTTRDELKYERMISFGKALPRMRRRIARDLGRRGLERKKVLAAMARLLDQAHLRVGGEEYERSNQSFGLATMKRNHAKVRGATTRLHFRSKSGKIRDVELSDPRLAAIVRRCQELPGQDLFQYVDEEGYVCDVRSQDINNYLRDVSGGDFTAKDFRTWAATIMVVGHLRAGRLPDSLAARKRQAAKALGAVAARLGNTPAVCRKSYVQPGVLEAYLAGALPRQTRLRKRRPGLTRDEAVGLVILQRLSSQT